MSEKRIDQIVDMEGRKIYDDFLFRQAMGRTLSLPPNTRLIKNKELNPWWFRTDPDDYDSPKEAMQVFEVDNRLDKNDASAWPITTVYTLKLENPTLLTDQELLARRSEWLPLVP